MTQVLGLMLVIVLFSGLGDAKANSEDVLLNNTTQIPLFSNGTEKMPRVLAVQKPCGPEHEGFCVNGVCSYLSELKTPICRCVKKYNGVRCEHIILESYSSSSPEEIIGISCGVVLLLVMVAGFLYFCLKKRCQKSPPPYKNCGYENSV